MEITRNELPPLFELDDACLLHIINFLNPLPDLFILAQTNWRLRRLLDRRLWLVVAPQTPIALSGHHRRLGGGNYATLGAAVDASRPGDTIWMAPGTHNVQDLVISWSLHIVGGGESPEDTLLISPKGTEAAGLDFRSTCMVTNLSMQSTTNPCILHRAGNLRVECCWLVCDAGGLDHLCAPLVTSASVLAPTQHQLQQVPVACLVPPAAAAVAAGWGASPAAGAPGKLTVVETQLRGGSRAVHCRGSGDLQAVRVVYRPHSSLFWLEVDCRYPGVVKSVPPSVVAAVAGAPKRESAGDACAVLAAHEAGQPVALDTLTPQCMKQGLRARTLHCAGVSAASISGRASPDQVDEQQHQQHWHRQHRRHWHMRPQEPGSDRISTVFARFTPAHVLSFISSHQLAPAIGREGATGEVLEIVVGASVEDQTPLQNKPTNSSDNGDNVTGGREEPGGGDGHRSVRRKR